MKYIFVLLLFLSFPIVNADYICRRDINCTRIGNIMKDINLEGYDKPIDFVSYNLENYYGYFTYSYYIFNNNKTQINKYNIKIFNISYSLSDENIKCVIKHELAHYKDTKRGSRLGNLSEEYANKYGCNLQ